MRKKISLTILALSIISAIGLGIYYSTLYSPTNYVEEIYFHSKTELVKFIETMPLESCYEFKLTSISDKLPKEIREQYIGVKIELFTPIDLEVNMEHRNVGAGSGALIGFGVFVILGAISLGIWPSKKSET
jgi:hypothetical protein